MPTTMRREGERLHIKLEGRWSDISDAKDKIREIPGRHWDPASKEWDIPADPNLADRVMKMIHPDVDAELMTWLRESMTSAEESLTSPLPADAKLTLPWADRRMHWQPEFVNEEKFEGLLPHQRAAVDLMARNGRALLADDMGLGKEQRVDTPVLMPHGWSTLGALVPGDYVIGSDGRPTRVEAVYPQGMKPLYRVTMRDGASTLAGEDHLWSVKTPNDRARSGAWRTVTTKDLMRTHDEAGNRRWSIPLVEPVLFSSRCELPINPYLLGVLLGDGSFRSGSPSIACHIDDASIIERCRPLTSDVISGPYKEKRIIYGLVGCATTKALRGLGLWGRLSTNKFIPEIYLLASIEDRLALLQGLMDTDGYNQPLGRDGSPGCSAEIAVSCSGLADGIQEIVRSLGGTAYRRIKPTTHLDSHRITVKLPPQFNPFQHPRKAARYGDRSKYPLIQPVESVVYECDAEAVCIRVAAADHLYVTEDYIVTHNTIEILAAVEEWRLRNPSEPDGPRLVVAPASVLGGWKREAERWLQDPRAEIIDGKSPATRHAQLTKAIMNNSMAVVNWEQLRIKKIEARTNNGGRRKVTVMKEPLFQYPQAAAWGREIEEWDIPAYAKAEREFGKGEPGWLSVAADEAHRAKNKDAQQTKGLFRVRGRTMFAATGTPIMNSPDEIWALLRWLWPDEYHEAGAKHAPGAVAYWPFYLTHVDFWEDYAGRKTVTGVKNPDALRYALKGKLIRRTASLLGLKGRKRFYYDVPLTSVQEKLYKEAEKAMWLAVEKEVAEGNAAAIQFAQKAAEGGRLVDLIKIPNGAARFVRQQQIVENAALLGGADSSANMDDMEQKFQDSRPSQWLVFCLYKQSCDLLAERLRTKFGANVAIYNGDVSTQDRTEIEDSYQRGELDVIVGTIAAMNQGITLTRGHLQHWLSRSSVPAHNEQGEARQDRLGQQELVRCYIPQAPDTVATNNVHPTNRLKEGIVKTILPQDEIQEG